jgi:tetratricopeptide (TPR) repeat protein
VTGLPRMTVKRRTLLGLLRRFTQPETPALRAPPGERADIEVWRGHLSSSEEALRRLNLRSIGVPEEEADPELCLVKGEVLQRAGHDYDAQRFLRRAARLSPSRRSASALALRAAAQDLGFQRIIEEADRARDAREWIEAGELYAEALRAYPDHYGYVVQYAHCLKEQSQFPEAECHYRSALALGARRSDVDEHLIFVATKQGYPANFAGDSEAPSLDGDPLDAPPTKADVELVVFLLLDREPALAEIVQLMRSHRSLRSLIAAIVEESSFVSVNARLLSSPRFAAAAIDPANG